MKTTTKQVWVSPKPNGGWRVHTPQSARDIVHLDVKIDAVKRATEIAKRIEGEIKVQNKNGQISQSNSYGRDPFPPRG